MEKLEYIEFHVTDLCNLNCHGCSHFSPMVKKNTCSFDSFEKDIKRLAKIFGDIKDIRLLGGEPFLEARLRDYVVLTRNIFPVSNIWVVTNGLLIPNVCEETLNCLRDNNIILDITLYPPTYERRFDIKKRLDSIGVKYFVSPYVNKFRKRFCPNNHSDPQIAFDKCTIGRRCTFVHNGELALCSAPIVVNHLNNYYNKEYMCNGSTINIHRDNVSAKQILEFLSRCNDSCKFCGVLKEEKWSRCEDLNNIDIEHWISDVPIKIERANKRMMSE